jgi:hypothetical protein
MAASPGSGTFERKLIGNVSRQARLEINAGKLARRIKVMPVLSGTVVNMVCVHYLLWSEGHGERTKRPERGWIFTFWLRL